MSLPYIDLPTRYYMKQENFRELCQAEFDGPAPKLPKVGWKRALWMLAGGAIALALMWAWDWVVFS